MVIYNTDTPTHRHTDTPTHRQTHTHTDTPTDTHIFATDNFTILYKVKIFLSTTPSGVCGKTLKLF